jgi:hypothetical protein
MFFRDKKIELTDSQSVLRSPRKLRTPTVWATLNNILHSRASAHLCFAIRRGRNRGGVPRGSSAGGIAWDAAKSNRRVSSPARAWGPFAESQVRRNLPALAPLVRPGALGISETPLFLGRAGFPSQQIQIACRHQTLRWSTVALYILYATGLASTVLGRPAWDFRPLFEGVWHCWKDLWHAPNVNSL